MIKYCCFYCSKLNEKCEGGCYNALGGKEYMRTCNFIVVGSNYQCAEKFTDKAAKAQFKIHPNENCWEVKSG